MYVLLFAQLWKSPLGSGQGYMFGRAIALVSL